MKKIIFSCLLILSGYTSLWSQLQWLNPQPSGFSGSKIQFINNSTGYLINSNGEFFLSSDTGNTWQAHGNFPLARTFKISDSTGIIPGWDSTYYISTDNGSSWESKKIGANPLVWVDIVGRDTIFLLKAGAVDPIIFFRSVDRGKTWQTITTNVNQFFVDYIDFVTSKIGYGLRADGLYKTTDGGFTWKLHYSPQGVGSNFRALKFFDSENGIMYRDYDSLLKTSDGGKTWKSVHTYPAYINDITYANANTVYATGEGGAIFKTTDGGDTWNIKRSPSDFSYGYDLLSQYFINPSTGIITGAKGRLLKTTDGGDTWKTYSPTYVDITAISFGDSQTGYATTWNNIYKTTDAGKTWNILSLTTDPNSVYLPRFERCRFVNKDTGFVTVNNPARVYTTTNGGNTWTLVNPVPNDYDYDHITDMSFISNDTGFISLTNTPYFTDGVFKTNNGGNNWERIGGNHAFTKLFFLNAQTGYATTGYDIFRTVDGGVTWTQLINYDYTGNTCMFFTSASKGFIAGDQGYLKMTTDSANTWTRIPVDPDLPNIVALKFYNDKVGYFTDDQSRLFKTNDGGYTWRLSANTANECTSIVFRKDTTVVFAGLSGTIVADKVDDYQIDSLNAGPTLCGAEFSGVVTSTITAVDSIFFEYGTHGFTQSVKGSPLTVKDNTVRSAAVAANLQGDSTYKMRIKILYKGKYNYSREISFIPGSITRPVITASFKTLSSSYKSGNQWYYNDSLIPGAVNQLYTVRSTGHYTVKVSQNGCNALSREYIFTRPVFPLPRGSVDVYPNPVTNDELIIIITRNDILSLNLYDLFGRSIMNRPLVNGVNHISLPNLQRGMYLLKIISNSANGIIIKNSKIMKL